MPRPGFRLLKLLVGAKSLLLGCHTWRAAGITIYLESDGRLELHDRTKDEIILSEVAPVSDDLGQKQGVGLPP
jgi:hypothetical protein